MANMASKKSSATRSLTSVKENITQPTEKTAGNSKSVVKLAKPIVKPKRPLQDRPMSSQGAQEPAANIAALQAMIAKQQG